MKTRLGKMLGKKPDDEARAASAPATSNGWDWRRLILEAWSPWTG